MSDKTILTILVKPEFVSFLTMVQKVDFNKKNKLRSDKFLGHYIYSLIENTPFPKKSKLKGFCKLDFEITSHDRISNLFDSRSSFITISDANMIQFNSTIEEHLKQYFDAYMFGRIERDGYEMKYGIIAFFQKFRLFDSDFTIEAFKKRFYRLRKTS